MQQQFDMVAQFHERIGATISVEPQLLPHQDSTAKELAIRLRDICREMAPRLAADDLLARRLLMTLEETAEWLEAHVSGDLVAAKDAWGDRCYLLLGDAVSSGFSIESIFSAVHRSNMTKRGQDPKTGKAIKSDGFERPQI
jgi:predicted HAD superfamily Cof-like phosphohydrolase